MVERINRQIQSWMGFIVKRKLSEGGRDREIEEELGKMERVEK